MSTIITVFYVTSSHNSENCISQLYFKRRFRSSLFVSFPCIGRCTPAYKVSVKPYVPSWPSPNQGQFACWLLISFFLKGMCFWNTISVNCYQIYNRYTVVISKGNSSTFEVIFKLQLKTNRGPKVVNSVHKANWRL